MENRMIAMSECDCCVHALAMLTWAAMTTIGTGNMQIIKQICEDESLDMECDERVSSLYLRLKEAKEISDIHTLTYGREGLTNSLLNEMAIETDGNLQDPKHQLTHTLQEVQKALGEIGDANTAQDGCVLCINIDTQQKSE